MRPFMNLPLQTNSEHGKWFLLDNFIKSDSNVVFQQAGSKTGADYDENFHRLQLKIIKE
jgi:hypothetical protein